jgi:hypothetical protein
VAGQSDIHKSKASTGTTTQLSTSPGAVATVRIGLRWPASELVGWPAPVYLLAKKAGTVGAGGDLRRYERQ